MRNTKRRSKKGLFLFVLLLIIIGMYIGWALIRPLAPLQPTTSSLQLLSKSSPADLRWPAGMQAAAGIAGTDILATNGQQKPAPMASTAKVITTLVVLQKHPLKRGETGPTITLSAKDYQSYLKYVAEDGSVVPVRTGEQITEYQMLQAIMLPSANNMADSLATWAYGSLPEYARAANAYLAAHGINDTHVGSDASGLSPDTVTTAADLVKLGKLALQNTVIADIAGQSIATGIPIAGEVHNVNSLLGSNGIIGIKTGNSDHAGGVYLGAAATTIDNKPVTLVTAVVGAPTLASAMQNSVPLIQSAQANFKTTTLVKAGDTVGTYPLPWGGSVSAVAGRSLNATIWNGASAKTVIKLSAIEPNQPAESEVGTASDTATAYAAAGSVPAVLSAAPAPPSPLWRLTHPLP